MHKVRTSVEVRYQETDQMGVVYHANYLVWFEIGRTKYIESLGFYYKDMEDKNFVSPVIDCQVSFHKPFKYGETAIVETWLEHYDGIRIIYGYHIINKDDEVCVEGKTKHVVVRKDNFRPQSIRKIFPEWHEAYKKQLSGV